MKHRRHPLAKALYALDRWQSGDRAELAYLREFEDSQYLTPSQHNERTLRAAQKLLAHAYAHCPFYRDRWKAIDFAPDEIVSLDALTRLPPLEKRDIQEHRDEMVAENWPRNDLIPNMTGGSTGTPISFYLSRDRACSRSAATWRHNRWAGYDIGDKMASLWGAARDVPPPSWKQTLRSAATGRSIQLNTTKITEDGLKSFVAEMKRFRPKVILSYAKSAVMLAKYIASHDIPSYQPEAIITTAEVLEDAERRLLEKVFGCQVFNRYGCREVSIVASECDEHEGLHIMAEGLYLEVVRGNSPAKPGEAGAVLVTDLLNYAMPLIRYRIGDVAAFDPAPCRCGRGLPRLRNIQGRISDFLVGKDGRLVSGTALTITMVGKRPQLGQVQIWQDAPGRVLFKIAPLQGKNPEDADFRYLIDESNAYLGPNTSVEFEVVDSLPCEPSGKFIFCRSTANCDYLPADFVTH